MLDTHVVLWWMADELDSISVPAKEAIAAEEGQVMISAVVIWEIAIKRQLGKLDAPPDLLAQLERSGVDLLPVTARHADCVGTLPLHHRDPFDRLLVAQAQADGLPLVTADGHLDRYGIKVVW
ncbi:MAG TPA: type II toxin-antitoxin system VapC family toxin [Solirubrobacterales bacterium]